MKGVTMMATAALLIGALGQTGAAQRDSARHSSWPLRAPTFIFQPGLISSNFADRPEGTTASTKFNFRVTTAIPTTLSRTTLVAIVQFTPWNTSAGFNSNSPSFVYGPVFSLVNSRMFSLDFDVLGAYGPAARATDEESYTHKLVLEADFALKVGKWLTHNPRSRWHSLSLYVYPDYVVTGLPTDTSRWLLLYGASLPIAP